MPSTTDTLVLDITDKVEIDPFHMMVLSAIVSMREVCYGINIQNYVTLLLKRHVPLVEIYEALIELALMDRITSTYVTPDDPRSRRIYGAKIPVGMVPYGPHHPEYPNRPSDWDKGQVLHMAGEITNTHGTTNELAWIYDGFYDGTDIMAYTSMFERGA
jgi:hypothetical protein